VKQALASILLTFFATFFVFGAGFSIADALAADDTITLSIQDHRFDPAQLDVPAGKGQATISIGPLKPDTYEFAGEYHEGTAQGQIVAK
jgi:hypothetical protein